MLLNVDESPNGVSLMQCRSLATRHEAFHYCPPCTEEIPEVATLSEAEQNLVKKKKSFRKNALQKADLERFVDKRARFVTLDRLFEHQE